MSMHPTVQIYSTRTDLAERAAEMIVEATRKSIAERGRCTIALSGGETPREVYRLLGGPPLKDLIDWSRVHIFFGDERMVPPTDPQSNYRMVSEELLAHVPLPQENIHRIRGESSPSDAAADCERELREAFRHAPIRLDLILLGLGEDGHTASLFPGAEALDEQEGLVSAAFVPRLNSWRVTLSLRLINSAREVVFLVSGKMKAAIVEKIMQAETPSAALPATLVHPEQGKLIWMLDEEAASLIKHEDWFVTGRL